MTELLDWKKIRDGDKSAFNKLFDRYYYPLCNFVSAIVRDNSDTEDIVIECFAKTWEERSSLSIQSSLQNYLITIAKNSAITHLRKNNKQFVNIDEISKIFINEEIDLFQETSIYNLMYEAIDKMPDQRRRILKMAAFEEKSYSEISQELGISVNTVKTQMARAYKFLRNELKVSQSTLHFLLLF